MIRPVTSADRAVLRELLAEFYDTDAVLHPLPASYHDAALDERAERAASASAFDEEERAAERVEELSRTYRLSPREQEVLALLAEGKTGRVIQQELFIAEGTFKAHTRHIYEKMGINSRKELFELLGLRS